MSLLDSALGGLVATEVTHLAVAVIRQHGGVSGLISQFEQRGLGQVVQSWVGTGANLPVTAEQIHQVLGSTAVAQFATKFGLNPQDFAQQLASILPQTVDQMTPGGVVPKS